MDKIVVKKMKDDYSLLDAFRGERIVGRLEAMVFDLGRCYCIQRIQVVDGENESDMHALFGEYLYEHLGGAEMVTWNREGEEHIHRLLKGAGFGVKYEKYMYHLELASFANELESPLSFKPLCWEEHEGFIHSTLEDTGLYDQAIEKGVLKEEIGDQMVECGWQIAFKNEDPVGLVLPSLFEGREEEGSLSVIAINSRYRGMGYGQYLFARGLEKLKNGGAKEYYGSTNIRNLPMQKLFKQFGCKQVEHQIYYTGKRQS